jgi:hypothetical protein
MDDLEASLYQFFTDNYKPGINHFIGTKDALGLAIRHVLALQRVDERPSFGRTDFCWDI